MKILVRIIQSTGVLIGIVVLAGIGLFIATAGDHSVPDTVATDATILLSDNYLVRSSDNQLGRLI